MLEAKFKLNNSDVSRLVIGDRSFPAFSGHQHHTNQRSSQCIPDQGPLPVGSYYITDRTTGVLQSMNAWLSGKDDWFALLAIDGKIDDHLQCQKVVRGNFRLHAMSGDGVSYGCVTVVNRSDFNIIYALLKKQPPVEVGNSDHKAYGILRVY